MQTTPHSSPKTDAFQSSVTQIAKTAQKQKKVVIILGTILLLVLTAVSLYLTRRSERLERGKAAFFKARTTLETELKAVQSSLPGTPAVKADPKSKTPAAPAAPASIEFTRFAVREKLPQGIAELEKVGKDFHGSMPGYDAYLLLGQLHLEHGATADEQGRAAGYYEQAASAAPSTDQAVAAYLGQAFALEGRGDYAGAVKTFERVANYGNTPFQADALRGIARNYELQKDFGNAKLAYERVASTFPNSEDARFARMKLAGMPGAGAASAANPETKQ